MDQNARNINNTCKADLVLDGIHFTAALLALAAHRSGISVTIKLPTTLNFNFQPELSFYYPTGIKNSVSSIKDFHFLLNCSSLFPHLFFPQRVLLFNDSTTVNGILNSIIDQLLGRDREWAALPINTAKYKTYEFLAAGFPKGTLAYEYLFDRNWAVVELLKMCQNEGVLIIPKSQSVAAKIELNCIPMQESSYSLILKNQSWPYKNNITIERDNFLITFQPKEENILVWIYIKNSKTEFNDFKKEMEVVFTKMNFIIPSYLNSQILQIFKAHQNQKIHTNNEIIDPPLPELRKTFRHLASTVSKQLDAQIKIDSLFSPFKKQGMNAEMFRQIQTECDEKFDLAKQTGIAYKHFVQLFYRYRKQIDEMIEQAYELMTETRNPEQIWQKVEVKHLKKVTNKLMV